MTEPRPVARSLPLLASGVVSLALGGLVFGAMDFGAKPGATFAVAAIALLLLIVWGIVGTVLGLATVVPGISR